MSPRRCGAALAAVLLAATGCGPGVAPACDAPETVERMMAHTFTAMLELGMPEGRATPVLDWQGRTIVSGADTAYFEPRGDSLYVSERRSGPRVKALGTLSTRVLYEDAAAGTFECEAAVDAGTGLVIPVRYTSTWDRDGQHVVRGSLKGAGGEVLF